MPFRIADHGGVLIFSDAGAARGGLNRGRLTLTEQALKQFHPLAGSSVGHLPTQENHRNDANGNDRQGRGRSFRQSFIRG